MIPYTPPTSASTQLDKAFGFETAVEEAQKALLAAKVEASSAYRGIGLVKLMGRHSGFIAVKVRRLRRPCSAQPSPVLPRRALVSLRGEAVLLCCIPALLLHYSALMAHGPAFQHALPCPHFFRRRWPAGWSPWY